VSGFEGIVGHAQQVVADGFEVDGVPEPGGERGHDGLGVVARAVEAAVHHPLHPAARRPG
jgi:hypothetical protein